MIERVATDQTAPLWVAVKFDSTEAALTFAQEMMRRLEEEAVAFPFPKSVPPDEAQAILNSARKWGFPV